MRLRAYFEIGANGLSLISLPATIGIASSSSVDERAQDARLRLPAQAEQNEVVPRQQRVDDLRHHRVFVADDAGEQRAALTEAVEQVLAHLVLHRAERAIGNAVRRALESAEGFWMRHRISTATIARRAW